MLEDKHIPSACAQIGHWDQWAYGSGGVNVRVFFYLKYRKTEYQEGNSQEQKEIHKAKTSHQQEHGANHGINGS